MEPGKILVIRGGALGDFLLTLPVLAALRRQFPAIQLELLAYPQFGALATMAEVAERVHPIEAREMAGYFARDGRLSDSSADFFSQFHLILTYLYDPDAIFRTNLARVTQAQVIQGPHRPNESSPRHATDQLLAPLENQLGIVGADPYPRLCDWDRPTGFGWLAVHPGSGSESKNWPEAAWGAFLCRWMAHPDRQVLLVGGEAEGGRLYRLAGMLPAERTQIARSLPLTELAVKLRTCAGFIGHDSGISHLGAALGLPGLVLWGPSNPLVWSPRSPKIELCVFAEGLPALPVEKVVAHLERLWAAWGHV